MDTPGHQFVRLGDEANGGPEIVAGALETEFHAPILYGILLCALETKMADSRYRPRFVKVLTTMLDALEKQEAQVRERPDRPAIPLEQLLQTSDGVLTLEDYERDPIGTALRAGCARSERRALA